MAQSIDSFLIRVLDAEGNTRGAGFVVRPGLAVTCAHVVEAAGAAPGGVVRISFRADDTSTKARVLRKGWSAKVKDDVAFLSFKALTSAAGVAILGCAEGRNGHPYEAKGFPESAHYREKATSGKQIQAVVQATSPRGDLLELDGDGVVQGMSGSPVLDAKSNRVVGMITEYEDGPRERTAYATTADTLAALNPDLVLWPDSYGPQERALLLQSLVDAYGRLQLPGGAEVPLEQIYVSLRADQMSATERMAEAVYLHDLPEAVTAAAPDSSGDSRHHHQVKAILTQPTGLLHQGRDRPMLFGERDRKSVTLAEVIQRHDSVVVLGDPGSGKTTLGRWLTVQFAQALKAEDRVYPAKRASVKVRADAVRAGEDSESVLDLGPARLPIFIRITTYAEKRWVTKGNRENDEGLSLRAFIAGGGFIDQGDPAANRVQEAVHTGVLGALAKTYLDDGRALVILDGLDEVGDSEKRTQVMAAVRAFMEDMPTGNKLLMTSRLVGYLWDPLKTVPHYTVEDMDARAIQTFCTAWTRYVVGGDEWEMQATQLWEAIQQHPHPGVKVLASNPLLLTLLAQVYQKGNTLPTRRGELFGKAVSAFWDQRRDWWASTGITPELLERALGSLAYHIHGNVPTGFVDRATVKQHLRVILKDPIQVSRVLEAADNVSGLLASRGASVYGFIHRSLQEYLAACHLVDHADPAMVGAGLAEHLLDPTWREPLVMAVGLLSDPGRSGQLTGVLRQLLESEDPSGSILPRREMALTAALAECESLGDDAKPTVERVAAAILDLYAQREGRCRYAPLRYALRRAFADLQRSPETAREAAEAVLCENVVSDNFERRFAAIDIIIELHWQSGAVVQALLDAWQRCAGPTGSMLVALEQIHHAHPEHFDTVDLPFRAAVETDETLWRKIEVDGTWQSVVQVLYMSPASDFLPRNILRDSPLSRQLLTLLSETEACPPRDVLLSVLRPLMAHSGSTTARDSAMALAQLGDESWLELALPRPMNDVDSVMNVGTTPPEIEIGHGLWKALRPLATYLAYVAGARALDLARDLARLLHRDLASARGLTRALALALASASARARALALALALASASARARDLDLDRDLASASARARDLGLGRALASARARDRDRGLLTVLRTLLNNLSAEANVRLPRLQIERHVGQFEIAIAFGQLINTLRDRYLVSETNPMKPPQGISGHQHDWATELADEDDEIRLGARRKLNQSAKASIFGMNNLETIASYALEHASDALIGTHFAWALTRIEHDQSDWLRLWISKTASAVEDSAAEKILSGIHHISEDACASLLSMIPHPSKRVNLATLSSLSWLIRLGKIPKQHRKQALDYLLAWLSASMDLEVQRAVANALGQWRWKSDPTVAEALLLHSTAVVAPNDRAAAYTALARISHSSPEFSAEILQFFRVRLDLPAARAALARIGFMDHGDDIDVRLESLRANIPDAVMAMVALLDAGVDDDVWNERYHNRLILAVQKLLMEQLEAQSAMLGRLAKQFQQCMASRSWMQRRITVSAIAAGMEVLPRAMQRAIGGDAERLLVQATLDAGSFNVRRFALTALSYLPDVSDAVVPALLQGCRDIAIVQQDAITAAGRFRSISGDPLPALVAALRRPSVSTAYGAAKVLGALGNPASARGAGLRDGIIAGLVAALEDEGSHREVRLAKEGSEGADWKDLESKGKLEDTLFEELLRVTGFGS